MINDEKTTTLLDELNDIAQNPEKLQTYFADHKKGTTFESLADYLNGFLAKNDIPLNTFVKHCGVAPSYVYNLFGSKRSKPNKYKLLPICISLKMTLQETNRALVLAEQPPLSPKIKRDCGIIICLLQGKNDIDEVNQFLFENGLETFES